MASTPHLSIVIPAYNEETRLPGSLRDVAQFVRQQAFAVEVLVVNNNSTDGTGDVARGFARELSFVRVLDEPRQGKGAAVRTGMLAAQGEYRFFCDADFSMPVEDIVRFLPPSLDGYDVAIASREAPGAERVGEPDSRHFMGRTFNFLVRSLAVRGIHDTQCGFKVFRRHAALDLFSRQTLDGWAFDVELLFLAQRRGYRLVEVPITWYYQPQSKVRPVRDALAMLGEVCRIRLAGWAGHYGPKLAHPPLPAEADRRKAA